SAAGSWTPTRQSQSSRLKPHRYPEGCGQSRARSLLAAAAGRVVEDLRHPGELFLQCCLLTAGRVAPGGFDFALALLPAFARGAIGDPRAQVVLHLAGLAAGAVGVAGQARRLQGDAAGLGLGVFAQVVVVVPGVALVQRWRREAFAVGQAGRRWRLRA